MRNVALVLLLIILPCINFASPNVYLRNLRIQPFPTYTRLVFNLTEKTYGHVKYFPHPDRVIIDFTNTHKGFNLQHAQLRGGYVKTINAIETLDGGVRFVLMVEGKVHWKIQFEEDSEKHSVRMLVDIIPAKPLKQLSKKVSLAVENKMLNTLSQLAMEANKKIIAQDKLRAERSKSHELAIKKNNRIYMVVIDPGHGGKDPGARGKFGTEEKKIALSIAQKLAKEINQSPNIRAILTRNGDYFIPLRERIKLARKGNADLFVAIHADAYFDVRARGASIYALSKHGATSEAARWLAQQENYSELGNVELDALKDRSLLLRSVLIDLAQTATIRESLRLGNKLLDNLDDISSLHHSQVGQAPFAVLKSPDIPSILVETGFITNPQEEKRLTNSVHQKRIARALATGIHEYINKYAALTD